MEIPDALRRAIQRRLVECRRRCSSCGWDRWDLAGRTAPLVTFGGSVVGDDYADEQIEGTALMTWCGRCGFVALHRLETLMADAPVDDEESVDGALAALAGLGGDE